MKRRNFLIGAGAATAAAIGGGAVAFDKLSNPVTARHYGDVAIHRQRPQADAPDVLFIALDDCNDWVGFLGNHPGTVTPNLDALAAESLSFEHAYCTAPMCVPARTSVMFGRAPYESGVYDHAEPSDERYAALARSSSALVDDFWAAGYDVVSGGKIFGDSQRGRWTQFHRTPIDVQNPAWTSPYTGRPIGVRSRDLLDFGPSGIAPAAEPDGTTTTWVRRQLTAPRARPLFLGYGLIGTHVAWRVPQKYFDMHPIENVVTPDYRPDDLDDLGPEGRGLIDNRTLDSLRDAGIWAEAVQAYQAAMSFADDRVGIVLDALARSPRADDTIVVVWSDHGFHLGEKLHWHKFTLWERATRIPMLFRVPGTFDSGAIFDRPVSAMDIGPTLADFAGVELRTPQSGSTLVPAIAQPALADDRPPISTWEPGNHAVRRGPWRLIRYRTGETELYDHTVDADEFTNLASDPRYAATVAELAAFLPDPASEVDIDLPPRPPADDD
jgi:arylsulfatase A-like enzyme